MPLEAERNERQGRTPDERGANAPGHEALQMLILALVFIVQAFVIFSAIALFSGAVGAVFRRRASASVHLNRLAGCAFIGLGIRMALPE